MWVGDVARGYGDQAAVEQPATDAYQKQRDTKPVAGGIQRSRCRLQGHSAQRQQPHRAEHELLRFAELRLNGPRKTMSLDRP